MHRLFSRLIDYNPQIKKIGSSLRYTITLKYVGIFVILLLGFHFIYLWWAGPLDYFPVNKQVNALFLWASSLLFHQSVWILKHIFLFDVQTTGQTIFIPIANKEFFYLNVSPECTSLKQWLHWLVIMLLFPGPWKHKIWYIPLGIIIIQGINIVRVVGLSLAMSKFPDNFNLFHTYVFKLFFYIMIFAMWLIWVELFIEKRRIVRTPVSPDEKMNKE